MADTFLGSSSSRKCRSLSLAPVIKKSTVLLKEDSPKLDMGL